jgi:drug/metabolite transporter superfamily protein YnfA
MPMMIAGVLLVLIGGVWILQGINVLPGSFMTGQTKWAVYGAVTALIGVALIVLSRRGAG